MDDIKPVSSPAPESPGAPNEEPQMEELENIDEDAERFQVEPSDIKPPHMPQQSGMRTWIVLVLVVLALIIGAAGVYVWQQVGNTNSSNATNEQLQSQIDDLNRELADAKKVASDSGSEAKDQEIKDLQSQVDTLTAENKTLTASNTALTEQNQALTDACNAATDCELPQ